jgi:hypothetical protein
MKHEESVVEIDVSEVLEYLRVTGHFAPALRSVIERTITAEAARAAGIRVSDAELQKAADAFRAGHGLHSAQDTRAWFSENGMTLNRFESFIETSLLIDKFKTHLEERVGKRTYTALPEVTQTVRDLMYRDWLDRKIQDLAGG